jgi:hypothetical protein
MSTISPQYSMKDILDRMHAIHQTISVSGLEVLARRYYPANVQNLPSAVVITPGVPVSTQYNNDTASSFEVTRNYQIIVWVADWMGGIPNESAQRAMELVIPEIDQAYMVRPRLEENDNGIVFDARLRDLRAVSNDQMRARLTYTLTVVTHEYVRKS